MLLVSYMYYCYYLSSVVISNMVIIIYTPVLIGRIVGTAVMDSCHKMSSKLSTFCPACVKLVIMFMKIVSHSSTITGQM